MDLVFRSLRSRCLSCEGGNFTAVRIAVSGKLIDRSVRRDIPKPATSRLCRKLRRPRHRACGRCSGMTSNCLRAAPGKDGCDRLRRPERARETQLMISLAPFLQQHRMNVAFEMIHCDQRFIESKCQSLGITDSDQQSARKPGSLGDGDGVDRSDKSVLHRPAPCAQPAQSPADAPATPVQARLRRKAGEWQSARTPHWKRSARPSAPRPPRFRRTRSRCRG